MKKPDVKNFMSILCIPYTVPTVLSINGGCSLYVPVRSCFEVAASITRGIWRGLQGNPLQIPQVMDTAASKQLHTGTYKVKPPLVVFCTRVPSSLFRAQKLHERSNLRAQNTSEAIQGPKTIPIPSRWLAIWQRIPEVGVKYRNVLYLVIGLVKQNGQLWKWGGGRLGCHYTQNQFGIWVRWGGAVHTTVTMVSHNS